MKKLILVFAIMIFSFGVSLDAMALSPCQMPEPHGCVDDTDLDVDTVNSANILDGSVTSDDIADGTITGTDLATGTVTSGNIAAGAVTDSEITGPISASKIEGLGGSEQVITVDQGGNGDFTNIAPAMASIAGLTSPTNRYLIKVMPGNYVVTNVNVESYVRLQGSGKNNTTLTVSGAPIFNTGTNTDIEITGFTLVSNNQKIIEIGANTGGKISIYDNAMESASYAIYVDGAASSLYVYNNVCEMCSFLLNINNSTSTGMLDVRNNIKNSYSSWGVSVISSSYSFINISDNILHANSNTVSYNTAVILLHYLGTTPVKIQGNSIKGGYDGIFLYGNTGKVTISDNTISNYGLSGIEIFSDSLIGSVDMFSNNILGTVYDPSIGIHVRGHGETKIIGNNVEGSFRGVTYAVSDTGKGFLLGNSIKNNRYSGVSFNVDIYFGGDYTVKNNIITGNTRDIQFQGSGPAAKISFNTLDTLYEGTNVVFVDTYNVGSNGLDIQFP